MRQEELTTIEKPKAEKNRDHFRQISTGQASPDFKSANQPMAYVASGIQILDIQRMFLDEIVVGIWQYLLFWLGLLGLR